jgi:ABC-2 type transport system ATP-binding protein
MVIELEAVMDEGKTILPACTLEGQIIGIYTDIQKMQLIMQQLEQKGYAHHVMDGHYKRLKVEETFRFYMKMAGCVQSLEKMLEIFGMTKLRKKKVTDLSLSQQQRIAFLRPYLYGGTFLIVEEPYQRMDTDTRMIIAALIQQLVERGTTILLLSNNLEDLLISTNDIFRIDSSGCHKMDFNEEQLTNADEEPVIKIEKIQTKKNDKTILFNPPEIDYIESVDGEILVNVAGVSYSCSLTLQELEKRLRAYGFYRCHRSYIVNLQKVREIITWTKNSYSLKLSVGEGTVVPLSRSKLSELKELIGIS